MTTKRRILLDELDAWRREGVLDEPTFRLLRSRYEHAPADAALDRDLSAVPATGDAASSAKPERRSFAADAMQFIGGLLLGAGLVALVVFLDVSEAAAPYTLLLLGAVMAIPAMIGAVRGAPHGLVEAGLSGGLVPMLVGVAMALGGGAEPSSSELLVPLVVASLAVGMILLRRGEGPTTLVAGGGFVFAIAAATLLREDIFFGEPRMGPRWLWFLAQLGLGGLLFMWRGKPWTEVSLAALVGPTTFAFAMLLEPLELTTLGMEFVIALWLAPILAAGVFTGSRGLVTGAAAGLTIDAVVIATDIGGAGTAVVVLLALGGLLVWQAENVRRYFREARRAP